MERKKKSIFKILKSEKKQSDKYFECLKKYTIYYILLINLMQILYVQLVQCTFLTELLFKKYHIIVGK
jgi:hypothetical protein